MKALLTTLFLSLAFAASAQAPVERLYVTTDRSVYLAGDAVWCSVANLNENARFSNASAVSYLELVSGGGTVCTVKIGLLEGRGAGSFRIPVTTPTGTYRLIAYTAVNAAESGKPWEAGSRLLTIFNSTTDARVPGGVEILEENDYEALKPAVVSPEGAVELSSRIRLQKGASSVLNMHNGGSAASVSLSIFHEDDLLPAAQENSPGSFLRAIPRSVSLTRAVSPETDGEVVSARIRGTLIQDENDYTLATLSTSGSPSDLYVGRSEEERIRFFTSNIYGDREIVCEVSQLDRQEGYIDFESPFVYPDPGSLPKLRLSRAQRSDLTARKAALRSEKALRIDTLTSFMPHRSDLLLSSVASRRYDLNDYTRFPSVQEVLVEIIPELHLRRIHGQPVLQLSISDALQKRFDRSDNILVMMDGVVVSDLNLLLNFDAMLIDYVDIYDQSFVCGKVPFHGLVNFITKNNYVTALHFPANVRVVDFQGVSYPVAYNGAVPPGEGQDLRQLLYWHPILQLDADSDYRLEFTAPGYAGRFKAVAEGFTEDGQPIHQEFVFEVE